MTIIPVLDLRRGQAVHAVGGERAAYAPVRGRLGHGSDVQALARACRDELGCRTCYVADLDALSGQAPQWALLTALLETGLSLWVDAGVSTAAQALRLQNIGVGKIILASESLPGLGHLPPLLTAIDPARLALSLDWHRGRLQGPAATAAALLRHIPCRDVILLDLDRVGNRGGPPLDHLARLQPDFPGRAFYLGGGIRHAEDLARAARAGAAGVLLATALHRGDLTRADLAPYQPANC